MSRNLARLEDTGLVARDTDADDARAARVVLTTAGRRKARQLALQEEAFAEDVLKRLPAAHRTALLSRLNELLEAVRGATEDCCPGAFDHLMKDFPRGKRGNDGEACRDGAC